MKRGQEEVTGFVIIVAIVIILAVIILALMIRNKPESLTNSKDVYQFLESTLQYTSSCAINYEPAYLSIKELIEKCRSGSLCISGQSACSAANETLKGILNSSWFPSPESPVKGYVYKARYHTNSSDSIVILISKGNCSSNFKESEYPGTPIITSFRICS
ncbi:hypothetical protein KW787_02590 [Candidatus Pacearchaeota archaeon]|nr:hypothetical protein [Candidatus Pacearchaeota archaeon]